MRLEDRGMRRKEFRRLIQTRLAVGHAALRGFRGAAGLMEILETDGIWAVDSVGGTVTIAAPGYHWLQLAPDSGKWWLTVMYDARSDIVQYYFDITRDVYVSHDGEARFHDLFLDIVMSPDGTLQVMDRDELDRAHACGVVDDTIYARALQTANELLDRLEGNEPEWRKMCEEILRMLENSAREV